MGDTAGMDEELLARAPFWVFMAVAEADGKIDSKERGRFRALLEEGDSFDTDWMKKALAKAKDRHDELLSKIESDPSKVKEELQAVADQAEQQLSNEEARAFKHDLLSLGKTIAEASGGILGFGDRIDDSEKEALALLIKLLRFDITKA